MKEILFSQNYLQSLQEKVILKRVDLVQFSPYMINMPVEGRMFFGRQAEIKRVEHKSQKNFAIVASRQAGKTFLSIQFPKNFTLNIIYNIFIIYSIRLY